MTDRGRPKNIDEYASLQVALMRGPREEILRQHGMDEDVFALVDAEFQSALSSAMDEEGDGVPALLSAYDDALRRARTASNGSHEEVLSLEEFAALTRALESGKDPRQVFESRAISFEQYMRASEHWTPLLASDSELGQRFMNARRR